MQHQKHRRADDLSPAEVRAIIAQRLRGTSRKVLALLHRIAPVTVLGIERGAVHPETFAALAKLPAAKRLWKIGHSTERADLIEARELVGELVGITEPHDTPHP